MWQQKSLNLAMQMGSLLGFVLLPLAVSAQAPGMSQTPGYSSKAVLSAVVSGDESREMHTVTVSIAAGGYSPEHVHPGDCMATVIDGSVDAVIDGKDVRRLVAGDAFFHARGAVVQFRNAGDTPVRMINVVLADKGKPRAMPPPAATR